FDHSLFERSDAIVYFDSSHGRTLASLAPDDAARAKLHSLVSFDSAPNGLDEVPDPYYAGTPVFDSVLELIERCCRGLFRQIAPGLRSLEP
ncbi:MAG TPA: low molecular weight phosphotyrosine protein phosphatase, partial [Microbacteriaceae bacterium]|nr:low molecular weight phosphotyrosine protein phosphatase [Microbacteriaceae bacterium]